MKIKTSNFSAELILNYLSIPSLIMLVKVECEEETLNISAESSRKKKKKSSYFSFLIAEFIKIFRNKKFLKLENVGKTSFSSYESIQSLFKFSTLEIL